MARAGDDGCYEAVVALIDDPSVSGDVMKAALRACLISERLDGEDVRYLRVYACIGMAYVVMARIGMAAQQPSSRARAIPTWLLPVCRHGLAVAIAASPCYTYTAYLVMAYIVLASYRREWTKMTSGTSVRCSTEWTASLQTRRWRRAVSGRSCQTSAGARSRSAG